MAAHRYWRLVGFATRGGDSLALTEARLHAQGVALDASASVSCTPAPDSGAIENLTDGVATVAATWSRAAYSKPGFAITWDFGGGGQVSPDYLRMGGGASYLTYPVDLTVQYSDDEKQWTTTDLVAWAEYPGPFALTASDAVDLIPTALTFKKVNDIDYVEFLPPALTDLTEIFASDTGQFTKYTEGSSGTLTLSGNKMTVTHAGSKNDVIKQNAVTIAIPQVWVECQINVVGMGGTGYDNGGVGIVKDANNFLFASMDRLANLVRLQIKIAGTNTFLVSVAQSWGTSFKLGLSLVANSVCIFVNTGAGWVYKTGMDVGSYYDFRTTGNLTGWGAGFTLANGGGNSVWEFSALKMGRFGAVGMRDFTVVTTEDGAPYISDDKVRFTASATDARGTAYCGVFELDLDTRTVSQTSVIFVQRGGKSFNDLSAHIIRYASGNRRMVIGTWGNGFGGSIQTLHALFSSGDILGGTNLVTMSAIMLPGQSGANPGAYDAMAVYDSVNSRWLIAYTLVENTDFVSGLFYPAACHSTDLVTFTLIGKDVSATGYEGTKILRSGSDYYIAAGGPTGAGDRARVYTSAMVYQGLMNVVLYGGVNTQPHPMAFPYRGKKILLTFDNSKYGVANFTWGNIQIYDAARSQFGALPGRFWSQAQSLPIQIIGSAHPTGAARSILRTRAFADVYNGGWGVVAGTVKQKSTPANTPLRRRVVLVDERSRITIRETWSDAVTGNYTFKGVKQGVPYTVLSYDHLHNYRAVAADGQIPELIA